MGTAENGTIMIKGCGFTNTNTSVYLSNSLSANVLGNTIEVPGYESGVPTLPYGIYIDGGTGFKVEDNTIEASIDDWAATHGIVINGTGAKDNEVYRNTLTNLNVAIQPQDENFGLSPIGGDVGLSLFCNTYSGTYDSWVAVSPNYNGTVGIASTQKMSVINALGQSITYPAGNVFSSTFRIAAYDFDNAAGGNPNGLYYYYEDNASYKAEPIYIANVITIAVSSINTCPAKSSSGSIPLSQLYTNLSHANLELSSSKLIKGIWQDGGNANLDEEVESTIPWEVYIQFNELLAESPYLSDDVLIATIENSAFTSLMIKLIMVANPQASRNDEIMDLIRDRIPEMPQSYIDEIMAEEGTVSQLDLLENNVSSDYHLVRMLSEDIKRNYRTDTINDWAEDSLLAFVSRQPDLLDQYELATIYLNRGLYVHMNTTLTNISSDFELNSQQNTDHSNYVSVFAIAQNMFQNEMYIGSLEEPQITSLESILDAKGSQVSQMALAILICNNPNYQYSELVLQPEENASRINTHKDEEVDNKETLIKLYPNPTTDYFTLQYQIDASVYSILLIEIYDATGRKIRSQNLDCSDQSVLIDVSMLSKGVYTVSFVADGNVLSAEKLTIVK